MTRAALFPPKPKALTRTVSIFASKGSLTGIKHNPGSGSRKPVFAGMMPWVMLNAEITAPIALNKPKGYVTTVTDPEGRPTVMDLVRGVGARVYPVGRLDYLSEGLLLMTNDGALVERLMHASSHVPKTYQVKVSGKPPEQAIARLRAGVVLPAVRLKDGSRSAPTVRTAPAKIHLLRDAPNPWYEVTLIEGRNRQIRRMLEKIGHHVEKIKRVAYGPLQLDVEPGHFRMLTPAEVARLKASVKRASRA